VIENPHLWSDLDGSDDEGTAAQAELLIASDRVVLMGRPTTGSALSGRPGPATVSDRINRLRTYVISSLSPCRTRTGTAPPGMHHTFHPIQHPKELIP
jgi:hypothetical protein